MPRHRLFPPPQHAWLGGFGWMVRRGSPGNSCRLECYKTGQTVLQRPESSPDRRWAVTGPCVEVGLANMCGDIPTDSPDRLPRQITQTDQNTLRRFPILILQTLISIKIAILVGRGPAAIQADVRGYWELSSVVTRGDVLMMVQKIAYRTPDALSLLEHTAALEGYKVHA